MIDERLQLAQGLFSGHRPDQPFGVDPAEGGHLAAIEHRDNIRDIITKDANLGQRHLAVVALTIALIVIPFAARGPAIVYENIMASAHLPVEGFHQVAFFALEMLGQVPAGC